MGSVFKNVNGQKSSRPAPPSKYIDEVNGIEQVPVTNSDGSITYITRKLPLSAEEQVKKNQLDKMASDALAELERLSSPDYVYSESTQQVLDDWQAGQLDSLNESFDSRKEKESDRLAKRGLSDSTAANTINRQTKQDEYDAKKNVERQKSAIGESIKSSQIANQQNLYSLAQNQLNYDQAKLQQSANSSLSTTNAINATNLASLNDYYTNQIGQSSPGLFINNILDPLSQQAGKTSTGALDSGVNGFINTITGGFL